MPQTPWGPVQHADQVAPGITFYSTAGHGGYHLSRHRHAALAKLFPDFRTFAGGPWYEEDEDYAVVVLAFHEHFTAEQLRGAAGTVRRAAQRSTGWTRGWSQVERWLESLDGAEIRQRIGAAILAKN